MSDSLRSIRVPTFCPVCDLLMQSNRSTYTYYDWGCCVNCYIWFLDNSPERQRAWREDGWRPSPEEIHTMKDGMGLT